MSDFEGVGKFIHLIVKTSKHICKQIFSKFSLYHISNLQGTHSNHTINVGIDATYLLFNPRCVLKDPSEWQAHLELHHRNPDPLGRAKHIAKQDCIIAFIPLSHLPLLAVKQPVNWRAWNSEKRSCSSFQTNYDLCNTTSFSNKDSMFSKCHLIVKGRKDLKTQY